MFFASSNWQRLLKKQGRYTATLIEDNYGKMTTAKRTTILLPSHHFVTPSF